MDRVTRARNYLKGKSIPRDHHRLVEACILVYENTPNKIGLEFNDLIEICSNINLFHTYYLSMPSGTKQQLISKMFVVSQLDEYFIYSEQAGEMVWDSDSFRNDMQPIVKILKDLEDSE